MEAKDTVMSDWDLRWKLNSGDYHIGDLKKGAIAQAGISFRAGEKQGRREVVEWLQTLVVGEKLLSGETGQAKLKEWGIGGSE